MTFKRAFLAAALATSITLPSAIAAADPQVLSVDLTHTRATFSVSHLGFTMMPGVFRTMDAKLTYDAEKPENSSLEVTIETDSLDMFNDALNTHLKSPDFFNVATHPTMTFKSTRVESTGTNTARVTGDFTLLGVTKPVTFDVTLNQAAMHPMSRVPTYGFGAKGVLKRSDFGMNTYVPMVGDEVAFTLAMEASEAAPAAAQ